MSWRSSKGYVAASARPPNVSVKLKKDDPYM